MYFALPNNLTFCWLFLSSRQFLLLSYTTEYTLEHQRGLRSCLLSASLNTYSVNWRLYSWTAKCLFCEFFVLLFNPCICVLGRMFETRTKNYRKLYWVFKLAENSWQGKHMISLEWITSNCTNIFMEHKSGYKCKLRKSLMTTGWLSTNKRM